MFHLVHAASIWRLVTCVALAVVLACGNAASATLPKREDVTATLTRQPQLLSDGTYTPACSPIGIDPSRRMLSQAPRTRGVHYLQASAEAIPLLDGTIDMVVSDHSPCAPALKGLEAGDFRAAWGGIASLQLRLPVVWTEARRRGFTLSQLAAWMCQKPAALARLGGRKGAVAVGQDADLVIFDPDASFTVEPETVRHRHPLTPYRGQRLWGRVEQTILRGALVYDRGGELPSAPRGEALRVTSG
jgi:hypothetical protein